MDKKGFKPEKVNGLVLQGLLIAEHHKEMATSTKQGSNDCDPRVKRFMLNKKAPKVPVVRQKTQSKKDSCLIRCWTSMMFRYRFREKGGDEYEIDGDDVDDLQEDLDNRL